jgi:metal-dependent amidase/aminoacylase/carboxypeptidase family protein
MNDFKQAACQAIEEAADELELLSKEIWSNPELNFEEHHAHLNT